MIFLERDRARKNQGKICNNSGDAIEGSFLEQQVVCTLMNANKECVACKSASKIGDCHKQPPGLILQKPRKHYLEGNTEKNDKKSIGIFSDQFSYFRMFGDKLFGTHFMRLTVRTPLETGEFCHVNFIGQIRRYGKCLV